MKKNKIKRFFITYRYYGYGGDKGQQGKIDGMGDYFTSLPEKITEDWIVNVQEEIKNFLLSKHTEIEKIDAIIILLIQKLED